MAVLYLQAFHFTDSKVFLSEAKSGLMKSTHLEVCGNVQAKHNSIKSRGKNDIYMATYPPELI
jgi:hypothetical protein